MRKNFPVSDNEFHLLNDDVLLTRTDNKGVITYSNQRFVEISGFTEDELMGSPHNLVRHPDVHPMIFEDMWRTIQAGHSWRGYVKNRCKNGDYYWVDANITPIRDNGQIVGYASIRVKPDREEVEKVWPVYQAINKNPDAFIVRRGKIYKRHGIKQFFRMRPSGITSRLSILSGLVATMIAGGVGVSYLSYQDHKQGAISHHEQILQMDGHLDRIGTMDEEDVLGGIEALRSQLSEMQKSIDNNATRFEQQYHLALLLSLLLLVLYSVMVCRFGRRMHSTLVTAKDAALQVAAGNLYLKLDISEDSEAGDLLRAMELMRRGINNIVDDIKQSAMSVQPSIQSILTSNDSMVSRIENQAAAIQETAASIEEISSTVKNSEHSASKASQASINSVSRVKDGEEIMRSVKASMEDISERSRQMVGLVKTIDSIAFQTNILALNASVEASRAGEHGRGFAVVAQEVRALANRSAEMAKQIQDTIEKTVRSIDEGVGMTSRSQDVMDSILAASEEVKILMQEISVASREQSDGVTQIEQAILEIDRSTQESAAAVSDYSTSSDELMKEADRLTKTASAFNIAQGEDASVILKKKRAEKREKRMEKREVESHSEHKKPASHNPEKTLSMSDDTGDDWSEF